MLKNIEAIARGYVFFTVNDRWFLLYSNANNACDNIPKDQPVSFHGLHIWKGWLGFYYRFVGL